MMRFVSIVRTPSTPLASQGPLALLLTALEAVVLLVNVRISSGG